MPIKTKSLRIMLLAAGLGWVWAQGPEMARAFTAQIEDDGSGAPDAKAPSIQGERAARKGGSSLVRIEDGIGFYYFLKNGLVVQDESKAGLLGRVKGPSPNRDYYDLAERIFVEWDGASCPFKKGDRLVLCRNSGKVAVPRSGPLGYWLRNLAIGQVLEVGKERCLVSIVKSFAPVKEGDRVKLYDTEMRRWKQAQEKKPLPEHAIQAHLAGLALGQNLFGQGDCVVLNAGSRKGIVEGMRFQLIDERDAGVMHEPMKQPKGWLRVFYAAPESSLAQIGNSDGPVENGCEAAYQP